MRWLRFAVLILAVAVLQKGVFVRWHTRPDLLLVLLVFFAVYCNTSDAIVTSFSIGFAADLIGSPMPMGSHMIGFGVVGTLQAYLQRVITIRRKPHQALAIFIVVFLTGVTANLLAREPVSANLFRSLLRTALCSGIVGPFLFPPVAWCMHMRINRSRRS
ncbi:MAG: rod shape-determining protein MreD [Phycisphaerales bacterium]|nr:MAG: rod shape-determining protein MreD [Phycisphaerales bacterium]